MNIPNQLTTLRVILIPVFMYFFTADMAGAKYIAAVIFIAASLTDFLDGYLARKWQLVSNFGKIMDPFADKLLVLTALIYLAIDATIPGWPVIIIIGRELLVTSLRALAADHGVILAARKLGKFKTISQMFAIIFLIVGLHLVGMILLYIAVALTLISMVDYLIQLKDTLSFN
ncbi:MAG: CDP-diacylglycerol--glycerol-3-phosphate 3-phosphatidyltransferase [Peptococcaceae bacterium]|nr:CDP-diacylglycerol--glycerol-3-phosphate 3-phosphatidyltransferase [Peptococcaceae bacterium]